MGTNYYIDTPSCANACEHCGASERHRLGKSSVGWRFLFYAEPDWPRDEAFAHWVRRAVSGRITDEYGEEMAFADLLDLIDRKTDGNAHTESRSSPGFAPAMNAFRSSGHDFSAREFS